MELFNSVQYHRVHSLVLKRDYTVSAINEIGNICDGYIMNSSDIYPIQVVNLILRKLYKNLYSLVDNINEQYALADLELDEQNINLFTKYRTLYFRLIGRINNFVTFHQHTGSEAPLNNAKVNIVNHVLKLVRDTTNFQNLEIFNDIHKELSHHMRMLTYQMQMLTSQAKEYFDFAIYCILSSVLNDNMLTALQHDYFSNQLPTTDDLFLWTTNMFVNIYKSPIVKIKDCQLPKSKPCKVVQHLLTTDTCEKKSNSKFEPVFVNHDSLSKPDRFVDCVVKPQCDSLPTFYNDSNRSLTQLIPHQDNEDNKKDQLEIKKPTS